MAKIEKWTTILGEDEIDGFEQVKEDMKSVFL